MRLSHASKTARDKCDGKHRSRAILLSGVKAGGAKRLRLRYFSKKIKVGQILDTPAGPVAMESSHFHHRPPHRTKAMKCPFTCCTKPDTKYFDPCTSVQIKTFRRELQQSTSKREPTRLSISKYIQTRTSTNMNLNHFHAHTPEERLEK